MFINYKYVKTTNITINIKMIFDQINIKLIPNL